MTSISHIIYCNTLGDKKLSSIYKIAEIAGVSASTVARALSGKGYCSEKTKKKILKIADELNYIPDHTARMLKKGRTEKILFCIPDIYNPFYFGMIKGANEIFEKYGYFTVLCYTKHNIEEELKTIQSLREKYGDGMIFVSFNFTKENIDAVNKCGMPVVLTNKYDSVEGNDKFDYVYVDTYIGIKMATQHLIEQGHERIAYIGGSRDEQTGLERFQGYQDALKGAGLAIEEELIFDSNYTREGGYACGMKILSLKHRPTAVVASNDLMAIGFMDACDSKKVNIPEDIAIVGMDDTDLATCVKPRLTSVLMRQEEIGRNAAKLLMERIKENRDYRKTIRLEPKLIIRESSIAE